MLPQSPIETPPDRSRRDESFPKSARLLRRKEFESVRAKGESSRDGVFRFGWRFDGEGAARLGLAVSARVGNAPVRNRIKRVVREVFRRIRSDLPRGLELVVVPLHSEKAQALREVTSSFRRLLVRLRNDPKKSAGRES